MTLLAEIQSDLLDPSIPLAVILRKGKVIASQLRSKELESWVHQELDGFRQPAEDLPGYRILHTSVAGTWTNGYRSLKNRVLPMYPIKDEDLRWALIKFPVRQGISALKGLVAQLAEGNNRLAVPADMLALVNHYAEVDNYGYINLFYSLGPHDFEQILDTVRTRLLDFILKLDKRWDPESTPPAQEDVGKLVSVTIYNNPGGGPVSVFDQRGQTVHYQFNASGDINIEAVSSVDQLDNELAKLRTEIDKAKQAGVVPEDTALTAQLQLLEASKEANSKKPERSAFLEKIGAAKDLLKGFSDLAGIVKALATLADVAKSLIPQ